MYVGRIVAIAQTMTGKNTVLYRVSSRSFPNREARLFQKTASIMPKKGFEDDLSKNPYIAYNCLRIANNWAVASNGSHTDPIIEKIAMGVPVRDAFASGLLAMDFEKDALNTPRIIAAVHLQAKFGFLGIIRDDALLIKSFELKPGSVFYVATYEHNTPCCHYTDNNFAAATPKDACNYICSGGVFKDLERPVTAVAAMTDEDNDEFNIATHDVPVL